MTASDKAPEITERMPAIYLSHGAPPLADDALWTRQLADWSRELPKPKSVLMVSAHWEAARALGATTTVPLTYDFWGFEDRYYQVRYPAPGAPELAATSASCSARRAPRSRTSRTGAWTTGATCRWSRCTRTRTCRCSRCPCPRWTLSGLYEIGRKRAPRRDQGVLIVGSGFFTHNTAALSPHGRNSRRGRVRPLGAGGAGPR